MKTITAYCYGGLGNRLKTLCSSNRIADELGFDFDVLWESSANDNTNTENYEKMIPSNLDFSNLFSNTFKQTFGDHYYYQEWEEGVPRDLSWDICLTGWKWKLFKGELPIDLGCPGSFCEDHMSVINKILPYLLALKPADNLQKIIDAISEYNHLCEDTVGIHIRKYHPSTNNISFDEYIKHIDRVYNGQDIFICTDDKDILDKLLSRYPQGKYYDGNEFGTVETMRSGSALIDMYLLSKCGTIIGSNGSTFNEVAWWLSGLKANRIGVPNTHFVKMSHFTRLSLAPNPNISINNPNAKLNKSIGLK